MMKRFGLASTATVMLLAVWTGTLCYVAAAPVVEANPVAKAVEPAKPDTSAKEVESLKAQLTQYAEQYELVVSAAKQVSLDEHARQHDQALSQQVQIKRLEAELRKLQSAPTARN